MALSLFLSGVIPIAAINETNMMDSKICRIVKNLILENRFDVGPYR